MCNKADARYATLPYRGIESSCHPGFHLSTVASIPCAILRRRSTCSSSSMEGFPSQLWLRAHPAPALGIGHGTPTMSRWTVPADLEKHEGRSIFDILIFFAACCAWCGLHPKPKQDKQTARGGGGQQGFVGENSAPELKVTSGQRVSIFSAACTNKMDAGALSLKCCTYKVNLAVNSPLK